MLPTQLHRVQLQQAQQNDDSPGLLAATAEPSPRSRSLRVQPASHPNGTGTPDGEEVGRRRIRAEKVVVTFGSLPLDDSHLVLLTSVFGVQPLHVLVVPPEWTVHAAHRSMRAAADPTNTMSGTEILEKFRRRTMPDHWAPVPGKGPVPSPEPEVASGGLAHDAGS